MTTKLNFCGHGNLPTSCPYCREGLPGFPWRVGVSELKIYHEKKLANFKDFKNYFRLTDAGFSAFENIKVPEIEEKVLFEIGVSPWRFDFYKKNILGVSLAKKVSFLDSFIKEGKVVGKIEDIFCPYFASDAEKMKIYEEIEKRKFAMISEIAKALSLPKGTIRNALREDKRVKEAGGFPEFSSLFGYKNPNLYYIEISEEDIKTRGYPFTFILEFRNGNLIRRDNLSYHILHTLSKEPLTEGQIRARMLYKRRKGGIKKNFDEDIISDYLIALESRHLITSEEVNTYAVLWSITPKGKNNLAVEEGEKSRRNSPLSVEERMIYDELEYPKDANVLPLPFTRILKILDRMGPLMFSGIKETLDYPKIPAATILRLKGWELVKTKSKMKHIYRISEEGKEKLEKGDLPDIPVLGLNVKDAIEYYSCVFG